MEHEHHRNQRDHERNKTGIRSTKEEIAFEHLGHPPHRILADQDRRDESHVSPHEKTKEQTAGAVGPIQPGWPVTFSRFLIQSGSNDDIDFTVHLYLPVYNRAPVKMRLEGLRSLTRSAPIESFQHGVLESRSTRMSPEASLQNWLPAIHAGMTTSTLFILWSERKLIMICFTCLHLATKSNQGVPTTRNTSRQNPVVRRPSQ